MELNRRGFIQTTAAAAGGLMLQKALAQAPAPKAKVNPYEIVPLGKTGLKVSRIGAGTGMRGGNRQSNHTRMGFEAFEKLLHGEWERGVRLFDLADMYGAHPFFAKAMKKFPRDQYAIVSKIWVRSGGIPEKERPDADVVIERFRKELDTDYIDICQIHCMTDKDWTTQQKKQMDIMDACKTKGWIKTHGVSIHSLEALQLCAVTPWVDVVHTRINKFGVAMDGKVDEVVPILKKIHDAGKGVIGMKMVGEGKFGADAAKKAESVQFVLGLGCVDAMIVGFEKIEQIDDYAMHVEKGLAALA